MSDSDLPGDPGHGPEPLLPADAEAPAWVGELLAGLRADDPPLPDHVAERIDRALSVLTPADVLPAAEPSPAGAATPAGPTDGGGDSAGATVIPLAARNRPAGSPNPWGHRLLIGGVAAAAALVLGGLGTVAVVRNSGGGPADGQGVSADSNEVGAAGDKTRYVASNQDYTAATLDTTAEAVLAASTTPLGPSTPGTPSLAPSEGTGSPGPSASTPPTATSNPASPSALGTVSLRAAAQRPAEGCVDSLAGADDVDPLLVDEATYEHRPAFVVVIATTGDAGTADVWVVARTCAAGNEGVLAFARIAR